MNKSVLAITALALSLGVSAQMPDNSVCPNWTGTDLNGVTHTLYDYLDDGYTVIVDVSATWCGPCWSYHNGGALENLYDTYGPGTAEDRVMVFMIEGDGATTLADLNGTGSNTQGDWVTGTPYPIIDNASIANLLEISYYPTIYKICPNRIITEVGQASTATIWSQAQACPIADSPHDGALLPNMEGAVACSGSPVDLKVRLQNMGTNNLTSATIQAKQGATVLGSTTWSGSLATYNYQEVNVTSATFGSSATITYLITTTDDDAANNSTNGSVTASNTATGTWVTLELLTDAYGEETDWELLDESGYVLAQDPIGSYADNTNYSYNWALQDNSCLVFKIYDAYGDGMCCGFGSGYYRLMHDGNVVFQGGDFGSEEFNPFKSSLALEVVENGFDNSLNVYPNPTSDNVTVNFNVPAGTQVSVDVYNVLGEVVAREMLTNANHIVDMSGLNNGVYYFNITAGDRSATRKVTVNK